MRRSFLLAVPVLLMAHSAHPQAIVICPTCAQEIPAVLNYAQTAANWVTQIEQMRAHYVQLIYTVESLKHLNLQSIAVARGLMSEAQHLPGSTAALMPGLNYGANLSGYGQQYFYGQNHYYTPEGHDWNAQEMQRREYATANLQGEAYTSMMAIRERLYGLGQLQASIPEQPDVTAVAAINSRIASEQAFLSNEQSHLHDLQLFQQTQQAVDIQRAEQHGRQQADEWNAAVAAQAWGH